MKLHIPVILFTALMAVLSALPSSAKYTLSIEGHKIEDWDGNLRKHSEQIEPYLHEADGNPPTDRIMNVSLRVEKEEGNPLDEDTIVHFYGEAGSIFMIGGTNDYYIGEGCTLDIDEDKASLGGGILREESTSVIELYGTIKAEKKATLFQEGEAGATTTAIINVHKDGLIDSGGYGDKPAGLFTLSKSMFSNGTVNTTINVEEGGTLRARLMEIGLCGASGTTTKTTLTLDGGAYWMPKGDKAEQNKQKSSIGSTSYGAQRTADAKIVVKNGGRFEGNTNLDLAKSNANSGGSVTLNLLVTGKKEGTDKISYFFTDGNISECAPPTSGETTQNTMIAVTEGASFEFGGNYLGSLSKAGGSATLNTTTSILVENATFKLSGTKARLGVTNEYAYGEASKIATSLEFRGDSVLDLSDYTPSETVGIWGDVLIGGGTIKTAEGADIDGVFKKTVFVYVDSGDAGDINLGGLSAGKIASEFVSRRYDEDQGTFTEKTLHGFKIGVADTHITGLKDDSTLTLRGEDNVIVVGDSSAMFMKDGAWNESADKRTIIEFAGDNGKVELDADAKVSLHFGGSLVGDILSNAVDGKVDIEVYLTNGSLTLGDGSKKARDFFEIGDGWRLYAAYVMDPEEGQPAGRLHITGDVSGVWASTRKLEPNESGVYSGDLDDGVSEATKVVIDGDTELKSTTGGTLEQLEGDHNLHITGEGEVNLDNTASASPSGIPSSTFGGTLTTDENVNLRKTGKGTLTLGGGLNAGGDVTVEEGELIIGGEDSSIGGQLTLGENGTLQVDGQLTLSGSVNRESKGSITGSGTLVLDGDMTFGDEFDLDQNLTIEMGEGADNVDFGAHEATLGNLTGDETITGTKLTVSNEEGEVFSGTLNGQAEVKDNFSVSGMKADGCDFTMQDNSALDLTQGGNNTLGSVKSADDAGATYKLQDTSMNNEIGDFVIHTEDTVDIGLHLDDEAFWGESGAVENPGMLTCTGTLVIENGATFRIHNLSDIIAEHSGKSLKGIIIMSGKDVYTAASYMGDDDKSRQLASGELEARVRLDNVLKGIFKSARIVFTNADAAEAVALDVQPREARKNPKDLVLDMETYSAADIRESAGSQVAYAGGMLLNHHVSEHHLNSDPDVLKVTTAIGSVIDSNHAEANRIRAAVAGSTLTSLSAAQSAALRNQMGRVRDHALQAARLRCAGNADEATAQQRPCKNSHVWVEGTSFFSEQHSVGDESGYRLNSWGGAVGVDAQVDAHWSVGLSLSAGYGDLEAHAADDAKGDLDTYTVSFWSQAKNGRWGNTLLFTLGTNEAELKRTVNYGAGSYTATSNASGSSLGAMWEVTYDLHPVKDNKSNILQPLFNVALTRTSMDGFSEKNAGNVGLAAEKQTRDTVTLGLGLRWLAAINSAKAVNRTVSTEVHANVAQDLGDRRSVANVALLADPSYTQNVYGSKTGSTAFQFGAGVNVPVTPNSQIYVNAGGELREHANTWSATLGVRMGF